jgi:hypothetical protein
MEVLLDMDIMAYQVIMYQGLIIFHYIMLIHHDKTNLILNI